MDSWPGTARARVDIRARLAAVAASILFALPFLWPVHRQPLTGFDAEWVAAAILTCAALAIGLPRPAAATLQWPLPSWLALLFSVTAGQWFAGMLHYGEQLYFAALYTFAIFGAYTVGRALAAQGLRAEVTLWICAALVGAGLLTVGLQILQLLDVRDLPWWLYFEVGSVAERTRPFGNTGQPNHTATFLGWALAATLLLVVRLPARFALWWPLALFVLAGGLALTRSRLGLLTVPLLLAALWVPSGLRPLAVRVRAVCAAALVLGYLTGTAVIRTVPDGDGQVVGALGRLWEGSLGLRWVMWSDALKIAAASPWWGSGFLGYGAQQYWSALPHPDLRATPNVHNIVLQLAAETGWPMALALVAIALWWSCSRWRERMREPEQAFAWLALAAVGLHSLVEFPLWYLNFGAPAALLFALAEPTLARGCFALRSRVVALAGACGLLVAVPLALEFDETSTTLFRLDMARWQRQPLADEDLLRLQSLIAASRMRPWAERAFISLRELDSAAASAEEIALHERLLWRGADPVVIAPLIVLHAKAGNHPSAQRHAERLAAFDPHRFDQLRSNLLLALERLGPEAETLRGYVTTLAK